jgi:hypothetical protein
MSMSTVLDPPAAVSQLDHLSGETESILAREVVAEFEPGDALLDQQDSSVLLRLA